MTHRNLFGTVAMAVFISGGAVAQEIGSCGQFSVLTQGFSEALNSGFDQRVARVTLPRGEARYVEFALGSPQTVHFWAEDDNADPVLTLFDSNGVSLAYDDDGAGDLNALLEIALQAGTYCAQVRVLDVDVSETPTINLWVSSDGAGFPEPAQDAASDAAYACEDPLLAGDLATNLSDGFSELRLIGAVGPDATQSGYRLSLAESLAVQIDTRSLNIDTVLVLTDDAGNEVARNDDHDGTDSRLAVQLDAGNYCVAVQSFNGSSGGFDLILSAPPAGTPLGGDGTGETGLADVGPVCTSPDLTLELARDLTQGFAPFAVDGTTQESVGRTEYILGVSDPISMRLEVRSGSLDTLLAIFDSDGRLVTDNDDHPEMEGTDSRVESTLPAGQYCVVVAGFDGTTGPYTLAVTTPDGPQPRTPLPDMPTAAAIEDLGILGEPLGSKSLTRDRSLWTVFQTDEEGPVNIDAGNLNGSFDLILMTEAGTELARIASEGDFARAVLERDLPAGRYLAVMVNDLATDALQVRQIIVSRP